MHNRLSCVDSQISENSILAHQDRIIVISNSHPQCVCVQRKPHSVLFVILIGHDVIMHKCELN